MFNDDHSPEVDSRPLLGGLGDHASSLFLDSYQQASARALAGDYGSAREHYEKLLLLDLQPSEEALVQNDLSTLDVIDGDPAHALQRLQTALMTDPACSAAHANQSLLQGNLHGSCSIPEMSLDTPCEGVPTLRGEPLKVAILSFLFNWPSTGGGIVHTIELATHLQKAGYKIEHVFAQYPAWGIGRVDEPLDVPTRALFFDDSTWSKTDIQSRFREAVSDFDPDYVIISDSWNFKPLLAGAVADYPYFLRLQALECLCPLNNIRLLPGGEQCARHQFASPEICSSCVKTRGEWSGLLHQRERSLSGVGTSEYDHALRRAFSEAEAVLVVNPLSEAMLGPFARDVRVITSGFASDRFPWPWPVDITTRENDSNNKTSIFFAGLIDEGIKGYHVLREACGILRERRNDFELVVTGEASNSVNDFTRFVGWLSQEDLPRHMRLADIVAVPAVAQEALGRTAVEAMGVGRPVIASRIGGLPYTVADGAGLLFQPGSAADLAKKLELLLDDRRLRELMGQAGRRRFEEHFLWDVVIEKHYRPLLSRRRARG